MYDEIVLPEISEIANWQPEQCQLERTRLRNELAFIHGDRACGGPPKAGLATALKCRLDAIAQRIAGLSQQTRPSAAEQ